MKHFFPLSVPSFPLLRLLAALVLCLLLCGCGDGRKSKGGPRGASVSAPYELLVVTDKEWLSTAGAEPLRQLLDAPIPCLPQLEPNFRVTTINEAFFSRQFQAYANILIAKIDPRNKKASCDIAHDVFARPQTVISLSAADDAAMADLCERFGQQILEAFNRAELQREMKNLARANSRLVDKQARRQFGVSVTAPVALDAIKQGQNFFWSSSQSLDESYYNFCLYTYPLVPDSVFTLSHFLSKRDSVMRVNIQGETEGSYMESDARVAESELVTLPDGGQAQLVRGLWGMHGEAMGGPYVSMVRIDSLHRRVLVSEGFVYAPDKKKRPYIRSLEAALYTVRILPAQQ
jgi:hypothetical protein